MRRPRRFLHTTIRGVDGCLGCLKRVQAVKSLLIVRSKLSALASIACPFGVHVGLELRPGIESRR